jgi:hypothetical protein
MIRRVPTYNELLDDVDVAADAQQHDPPLAWTWRGRPYTRTEAMTWWVSQLDWWAVDVNPMEASTEVRHWLLEASSDRGNGVVEITYGGCGGRMADPPDRRLIARGRLAAATSGRSPI